MKLLRLSPILCTLALLGNVVVTQSYAAAITATVDSASTIQDKAKITRAILAPTIKTIPVVQVDTGAQSVVQKLLTRIDKLNDDYDNWDPLYKQGIGWFIRRAIKMILEVKVQ